MAVLAASAVLALVSPGSAQAASSSCSGRKVRTLSFATGSVRIYRRGDYVCAVTVPKKPGARKWMSVSVQAAAAARWSTPGTSPVARAR